MWDRIQLSRVFIVIVHCVTFEYFSQLLNSVPQVSSSLLSSQEADSALLRNLEFQIQSQFLQDDINSTRERHKKVSDTWSKQIVWLSIHTWEDMIQNILEKEINSLLRSVCLPMGQTPLVESPLNRELSLRRLGCWALRIGSIFTALLVYGYCLFFYNCI